MLKKKLYFLGIVLLLQKATLPGLQNGLYSKMVDVAMAAAHLKRVYTVNKLQMLTFAAITSVWISLQHCNLAYNVHHGLAHQPRYSISPVDICAYGYEGSLVEEIMKILFTFTAS